MQHVVDVDWEVLIQGYREDQLAINCVQSPEMNEFSKTVLFVTHSQRHMSKVVGDLCPPTNLKRSMNFLL